MTEPPPVEDLPRYRTDVSDLQERLAIDEQTLIGWTERVLLEEEVRDAEVSVVLVSHDRMREIHREFLDDDTTTDVMSFVLESDGSGEFAPDASPRGTGVSLEGEIIICAEMAADVARKFEEQTCDESASGQPPLEWSSEAEVLLYLTHGLLHLVGYDDLTEPERILMRRRERELLALRGLVPPWSTEEQRTGTDLRVEPEPPPTTGSSPTTVPSRRPMPPHD